MTATESQAAPDLDLDSPAYGPQPPARADLYACGAGRLARAGSRRDAEFDRLLAERIQTEIVYKNAFDRDLVSPGRWKLTPPSLNLRLSREHPDRSRA